MKKKNNEDEIISVQVILKPSTGKQITKNTKITSKNINDFQVEPETYFLVKKVFQELGFEAGPFVGISFSISGLTSLFIKTFSVKFEISSKGNLICRTKNGLLTENIPTNKLPLSIRAQIHSIVCPEPPDFGPKNF